MWGSVTTPTQYTALHCNTDTESGGGYRDNTLQHTATHCTTLQHTAYTATLTLGGTVGDTVTTGFRWGQWDKRATPHRAFDGERQKEREREREREASDGAHGAFSVYEHPAAFSGLE